MSYLVRRVQINNWMDGNNFLPVNKVKADGITIDLKSKANAMSFWEIESLDDLNKISIALLTTRNELSDFFVVAIPKDSLQGKIEMVNNGGGGTAYKKFKSKHYDLVDIDLEKVIILIELILNSFKMGQIYDFTYEEHAKLLKELIDSGEINLSELQPKIKTYLKEYF